MLNIKKALQERIRGLSEEMADLELETAAQHDEDKASDKEWVVVRRARWMTQPATPHSDQPQSGRDELEDPNRSDEETEASRSVNSSTHSFDVVEAPGDKEQEGTLDRGPQHPGTPHVDDFRSEDKRLKSTEESRQIKEEIYLNLSDDSAVANEQENMSQPDPFLDHIEGYGTDQQIKREHEMETSQSSSIAVDEPHSDSDPDVPDQLEDAKPRDDVPIKVHFMATFTLLEGQYQQIRAKLVEEIFTGDIWQTWQHISEEDRADQILRFRLDLLFRDYREGHCLNQDKFRDEDQMVVFDSYLEQLIDFCCEQWGREESRIDSEVAGMELVPRKPEVLRQEVAEDICRNFMLVEPV
jgi:hypothetical protein